MEVYTNEICESCTNGSFDKCEADFTQITLDDVTRAVVDCEIYKRKAKHKLKITYECEGKIAVVENEGYTVEDFKTVIDKKFKSWGNDPKMSLYLRPSTLFGTRFGEYLNEYQAESPEQSGNNIFLSLANDRAALK